MKSRFFLGMSFILLLIAFAGFAQTFYLRPLFNTGPEIPIAYVHGIVMTAWLVILLIQTSLVAAHRTDIHRQLGLLGTVVGVGVIVMGLLVTVQVPAWLTMRGYDFSVEETQRIWSQIVWSDFGSMIAFCTFFGLAIFYRRRTDIHKRLMLLASISILGPALARVSSFPIFESIGRPIFSLSGLLVLVIAIAAYDLIREKRVHIVTMVGGTLFLVVRITFPAIIGNSAAGRAIFLSLSANS